MITTRTPVVLCPVCGHTLDAASSLTTPEARPEPGDFTVCIECARVLQFDARLRLVSVPAATVARELTENEELQRTVQAIRHLRATVGPPPWSRGKPN